MTDRTWKAVERRVAKKLGGTRIPLSGRNNLGQVGDIILDGYSVEVKSGRQVPVAVIAWLETLRALAHESHVCVLVMQPKGKQEMVVALTLRDFQRIVAPPSGGQPAPGARDSGSS